MKKKLALLLLPLALSSVGLTSCGHSAGGTTSSGETEGSFPTYNEPAIAFHYKRSDGAYKDWALWLWEKGSDGAEFTFNGYDSYGGVAVYPLSKWSAAVTTNGLGFIVRTAGSWTSKDPDGDRFVDFSLYKQDANKVYNVYLVSGDKEVYDSPSKTKTDAVTSAYFTNVNYILCNTTNAISAYSVKENGVEVATGSVSPAKNIVPIKISDSFVGDVTKTYSLSVTFEKSGAVLTTNVGTNILYRLDNFKNAYTYEGNDLGVTVAEGKTTFKVWSPVATSMKLYLYDNGTPVAVSSAKGSDAKTAYDMVKGDKGVWSYTYDGIAYGKYYTYFTVNSKYPNGKEVVDPYAKGCGVNGRRGLVVDFSLTNPDGWSTFDTALPIDRKSLCVDEMHIADLTSDDTWGGTAANAKKYAGFYEAGTTYQSGSTTYKTGFDHIKELGVNAIQLQPIFDQDNDETNPSFNWGYNPLNYNCLEGSYSANPYDGYTRIKEFKSLVKAYHDAGINIIMDVVYNHTSGLDGSAFDVLVPGYYYRYTATGAPYSGSGCGNDTASEMPMMRKFMLDSTAFWEQEYKLGGYRFDLMGLHDLDTMNAIAANCAALNSKFCIYGEPWNMSTGLDATAQASQNNASKWVGYGGFNDQVRDALIAGGMHAASDKGWIANTSASIASEEQNKITSGVKGITYISGQSVKDPNKTTNYVTCHDNYTLYDRFYYGNKITDKALVKKMAILSEAVALLSQGTSFFQGGEEFLRTKNGNSNSYDASYATNAFHYELKAANADVFAAFQKLIALKTSSGLFNWEQSAIASGMTSSFNAQANVLTYVVNSGSKRIKVVCANGYGTPGSVDLSDCSSLVYDSAGQQTPSANFALQNYEVAVASAGF